MPPDERERSDEAVVASQVAALVGEESVPASAPGHRGGRYPTTQELAAIGQGVAVQAAASVTAELEGSWRMWLDHVFLVAGEERARRTIPALVPATATRGELLVELERRRPGVTGSHVLMALLADVSLLRALVDALAVVDALPVGAR